MENAKPSGRTSVESAVGTPPYPHHTLTCSDSISPIDSGLRTGPRTSTNSTTSLSPKASTVSVSEIYPVRESIR